MFTLPHKTPIYLYRERLDLRCGMYNLQGLICNQREESMTQGGYYVFINKPGTLINIVWQDASGINFFSRRLEEGTYSWPKKAVNTDDKWMKIQPTALMLLLEGIELKNCMKKAWYEV